MVGQASSAFPLAGLQSRKHSIQVKDSALPREKGRDCLETMIRQLDNPALFSFLGAKSESDHMRRAIEISNSDLYSYS
jgi:hypothetical protein